VVKKRQKKHIRRSKKGKPFWAGSKVEKIPKKVKKEIVKERMLEHSDELKKEGRTRIPELGVFRLKVKKAKKARWGKNPFTGERMRFKAKPKRKVVKFRAAKALLATIN
jgi:nucleoid DNA-binding protein